MKIEGLNAGCELMLCIIGANLIQCFYRVYNELPNAWQQTITNSCFLILEILWLLLKRFKPSKAIPLPILYLICVMLLDVAYLQDSLTFMGVHLNKESALSSFSNEREYLCYAVLVCFFDIGFTAFFTIPTYMILFYFVKTS